MDLSTAYRTRFAQTGLTKRRRVWRTLCDSYFNGLVGPDHDVLDLACGYGEFINNVSAKSKTAVDMNPDAAGHLDPGIRFIHTSATAIRLPDAAMDVVFTSNFLEHLNSKAECDMVFSEVLRILRPGGRFIVMGPNIKYCYKSYWDFYDHNIGLSHLSLAEGLMVSGFEVVRNIDRFLPFTMTGKTPSNDFLIKAYLALPPAWKLMGQQFLVVARKPPGQS